MSDSNTTAPINGSSTLYERLRGDLVSGRFKAGEKIAISALRDDYQVSLSPLREALSRLAAYGLLIQENQRGFRVPKLDRHELDDLTELRLQLEGDALVAAVQRGDAQWEAELLAAAHRLKRAEEAGTREQWEHLHGHFHRTLVAPCGSPWRLRFIAQLHDQFDRYRRLAPEQPDVRHRLNGQHADLVELALDRHAAAARELLHDHIARSCQVALGSCDL